MIPEPKAILVMIGRSVFLATGTSSGKIFEILLSLHYHFLFCYTHVTVTL